MSTNLHYRKKQFTGELLRHLAKLPSGSWTYRQYCKVTLKDLANDLAFLGVLPLRAQDLNSERLLELVKYWRMFKLSPKTIKNKLAMLRRVLSAYEKPIEIPTNKELGVIVKTTRAANLPKLHIIDPSTIQLYPVFIIQEVCTLQYLFGLKVEEAMKLDINMVYKEYLKVPRSISFNNKDRTIPIHSADQQECIAKFKTTFKGILPISRNDRQCFIALYQNALQRSKISHKEYFRHCYIKKRYQELFKDHTELEALEIVSAEVGYIRLDQIWRVLSCLENF
jgi:hypothetical protein